jgi:hypothetical protein
MPTLPADPAVALLTDLAELARETRAIHERERRHDRLAEISQLVVRVRDVALAEADPNGSLQGLGPRTFPQTQMQLQQRALAACFGRRWQTWGQRQWHSRKEAG